ncbi:unnamed protein product [Rotaria magnacalcarata]|uniref:Nucleotide-diphospho-sugar transferase domain-containing protein n=3 Tax=Rotaria magnacalcarata TaxID=392030 RepID=A0A814NJS0_9BILA|nr:unnamed protein product [Rotaria magnacalcarata]
MIPSVPGSSVHSSSSPNAANYGSAEFNTISIAKITAIRKVLELGYNVLFSDVDIAWNKNPVPFLPTDVDLVIQSNSGSNLFEIGSEANTGFYFLKSNSRSTTLLNETLHRTRGGPGLDDQIHFGNVLREWRVSGKAMFIMEGQTAPWVYNNDRPFTFRVLHPYRFQTGQVAQALFGKQVESPYDGKEQDIILVHANYMIGHTSKVNFFKSHGLWNVNDAKFKRNLRLWNLKKKTHAEKKNQRQNISSQSALQQLEPVCMV